METVPYRDLLPRLAITAPWAIRNKHREREDLGRQGGQCSSIRVHTAHLTQLLGTDISVLVLIRLPL